MTSDFGSTVNFRLVADDPSTVSSASGPLSFTAPERDLDLLEEFAIAGIVIMLRCRRR